MTTKPRCRWAFPKHIWAIVWAVAGFVALVAGMLWGFRAWGVQFALTLVVPQSLARVDSGRLYLGAGAIVGGLIRRGRKTRRSLSGAVYWRRDRKTGRHKNN